MLQISNCETVNDVSCFRDIPNLSLRHCRRITDVSALGKVHTLNLSGCDGVLDLSSLESVYSLTFHHFVGTDLSGLKNIAFLDIFHSWNVADVTMLRTFISLNVTMLRTMRLRQSGKSEWFIQSQNIVGSQTDVFRK
jgi:hypothetical protein